MSNSGNFLPNSGYNSPNPYLGSNDSNSNSQYKITRLTADRVEPNFYDLQDDDVQSINNPDDSETWYECKCGVCYECINNYDEVERDDDERDDEEYYGEKEYDGEEEYNGEEEYDGEEEYYG